MTRPLLIDLADVPGDCCDHTLEALHKALADPPGDRGIWEPHHDPLISELIETVTARGQQRLLGVVNAVLAILGLPPAGELRKANETWRLPSALAAELEAALSAKPVATYTLDDWLTVVELIVNHYLPPGVIHSEAEWLTVRARMAAQIQANIDARHATGIPGEVAYLLGHQVALGRAPTPERLRDAVLANAEARAATLVRDVTDKTRSKLRLLIIEREKQRALGASEANPLPFAQRLLDEFGTLNRDWRRIAITECGNNQVEGYLATLAAGTRVQRVEVYPTACGFCKRIHGAILTVVDPAKEPKNWDTEVWIGKTNEGRSASPRKWDGGRLVPREDHELWKIPAGLVHMHCRGRWLTVQRTSDRVDPKFAAWLDDQLQQAGLKVPPRAA